MATERDWVACHYPGPVGLARTLPGRPFQLLASFVDGFHAARLIALTARPPRPHDYLKHNYNPCQQTAPESAYS